jgi:TorA maturation chaperone TorD
MSGALSVPSTEHFEALSNAYAFLDERGLDSFSFFLEWRRHGDHYPVDERDGRLDVEYVRLFASGVSGAVSPPIESYYRSPIKGGESASFLAKLTREYASMGVRTVGGEAPDHVSTEMEVMSVLCAREAESWEASDQVGALRALKQQHRFLSSHLSAWVPQFHDRTLAADPLPYYRDLSTLTHALVIHETHFVPTLAKAATR